jgi:hypothetical protein
VGRGVIVRAHIDIKEHRGGEPEKKRRKGEERRGERRERMSEGEERGGACSCEGYGMSDGGGHCLYHGLHGIPATGDWRAISGPS